MRHRTPLLVALVLVASGLAVAGSAMGHTSSETPSGYEITDQGMLTGYGGPVVNPLGGHVENPTTGENVFVPCAQQGVRTAGTGGEHQHAGSCVAYDVFIQNKDDPEGEPDNLIEAEVDYENRDLNPHPSLSTMSADLDMHLYGPNGEMIAAHEGADPGSIGFTVFDEPAGSYTVLLVARHGVAPYDTTITVTD